MQLFHALIICLTLSDVSRTQIINHHIPKINNKDQIQLKWPKLHIVAHLPLPNGTLKRVPVYQDPGTLRRKSNENLPPSSVTDQQIGRFMQQPIESDFSKNNFLERKYYNSDQLQYAPENIDHVETFAIKLEELHKYLNNVINKTVDITPKTINPRNNPPKTPTYRPKIGQSSPQPHFYNWPKTFWSQDVDKNIVRDQISEMAGYDQQENFDVKAVKQDKNGIFFYVNILNDEKKPPENKNLILVTSLNNTAKDKMVFLELKRANKSTITSDEFKNKIEPLIITSIYRQFVQDLINNATTQKQLQVGFKLDPIKQLPNNAAPKRFINQRRYK